MTIDAADQIEKFQEFVEQSYQKQLHENLSKGLNFLVLDFFELTKFDPKLADQLLEEPEETLKAAEMALEQFDVKKGFRVRFKGLPKSQEIYIKNLRSKHLNKFIAMEGIIRQSSEVRPQAVSAKFECPSCGNTITMPQIDSNFREPSRCSCGRKGKFRLLSKELVDVQRIVIEESPENLEGGAQPKRMQIFLREDLVEPKMEKRTTPGTRIIVNGLMFEIPVPTKTGGTSTRFDLGVNGNFVEPVEEDYTEINITPEDEVEIKKLAKDKNIYKRLVASISPSIYGHDKIKEAILLQLFGGIRKTKADQTIVRGDLHVLLVGDPGCIVGDSQVATSNFGMKKIEDLGKKHLEKINVKLACVNEKGFDYAKKFHKYEQKLVLKVVTETGKQLICTLDHLLLSKEGWKRADCFTLGEELRVMPEIKNNVKDYVKTNFSFVKKSSGLLKDVKLPKEVTPELAGLYGYIIGDGNVHLNGYRITCYVSDAEKELIIPITNLWKTCFEIEPYFSSRDPKISMIQNVDGSTRQIISTQQVYLIETNSKHIAQSLSFLSEKKVPQSIFQSPISVVASFLKWLFEADGCAFGNGRGRTSIQLKSRYSELLRDVQLLLLYFGIQSRIVEDNLCIRRAFDMNLFIENIGFVSEKKNNALLKIKEVINQRERKRKGYQEWEKIVSIDFAGVKDVYDFEVPESHMFIANGIVSHNCGKSQMLTFVEKTAPKARYVAGRSASGAGLCVSPNSFVLTNPGGMPKIQDLVEQRLVNNIEFKPGVWKEENIFDVKIQSMSNELKMHSKKPDALWKLEAPRKMFRITLSSGKQIELTGNTSLFSIEDGFTYWRKSNELKVGEYVATPRTLIGGVIDKKYILDFVNSNPVVHNVKPFVKEIANLLVKKYGSLRKACKVLKISENQLYHHWVNDSARGNIKLRDLVKISDEVGLDYHDKVVKVSLYNGKNHSLPLVLNDEVLYLAGLVAGDGHIRKNNSTYEIGFSNSLEDLHSEFQKILTNQFRLHYYSTEGNKMRPKQTRCSSKILGEVLFGLGLVLSPKSNKIYLSEDLLHMRNNLLAHYIAGLYDTDGSVYVRKKGKGSSCIDLTTCSEKLARQLQSVLLRYNIHASLRIRNPSVNFKIIGKHKKYILEIRSLDEFKKFYEFIPLRNQNKKQKLEELLKTKTKSDTNIDIVPGISVRLKSLLQKNNYSLRKFGWHKNFSREGLLKILDKVKGSDFKEIKVLAKSDIFWEKIVNIEMIDTPYDYVYDLTIDDSHNFVVDGVLVHNTCSVVKDEFLRGWALEAGAMVLADKGILVLDEMDKISKEDTSALHEAMEQQHISVAKANIQACYSEDTEILTEEGWKKYNEVEKKKIAQYDPKEKTIKFLSHKGLYVYDYNKEMYHFKNKRNDIFVTPNHKMLFKEIRHKDYQALEAENISFSRINFLNSGDYINSETEYFYLPAIKHKQNRKHIKYTQQEVINKIPMDLWLEFLGYFVSEGGLQGPSSFGIPQKDKNNVAKIKNCLVKLSKYLGFTLSETKEGIYTRFQITNTQLYSYLEKNCGHNALEKKLPVNLSQLSKRQMKILFDAMMLGDGQSNGKSYSSSSSSLIDMFQAIACLVGKSANQHVQYEEGYRVNKSKHYRVTLSNLNEPSIKMCLVKKKKYNGKVYCFSTKTGFFITRRNGKITIQGNTLRTQTSILAAANPKMGRFDPFTPIPNQIDLPPALINRFDLIFVMRDLPNREMDANIASKVLESHAYKDLPPEIDGKILRKYIAYTRQKIFPKLTEEAIETIKNFYVSLRATGTEGDSSIKPIPISARQLEAVVRLAEASAKIKLKQTVDQDDALRAIALLRGCMNDIGIDPETGKIDIDRMTTGISASSRGRILDVRDILYQLSEEKMGGPISIEEDLKPKVFEKGITERKLEEVVDALKKNGDFFEPKKGWLQKI